MGTKRKRSVRSEAAMREAMKHLRHLHWDIFIGPKTVRVEAYAEHDMRVQTVAVFDLRDCYRKRAPLKGITKKLRKAIQPKRSKK